MKTAPQPLPKYYLGSLASTNHFAPFPSLKGPDLQNCIVIPYNR